MLIEVGNTTQLNKLTIGRIVLDDISIHNNYYKINTNIAFLRNDKQLKESIQSISNIMLKVILLMPMWSYDLKEI